MVGRIMLVVFSLLILVLWVLVFLILIATVALGAICGVIRDFNNGDRFIINEFKVNEMTKKTIEKCFFPDSDGNMSDIINSYSQGSSEYIAFSDTIDKLYLLFDGISAHWIWDENQKNESFDMVSRLKKELAQYTDGNRFDTIQVQ